LATRAGAHGDPRVYFESQMPDLIQDGRWAPELIVQLIESALGSEGRLEARRGRFPGSVPDQEGREEREKRRTASTGEKPNPMTDP
jgi:hypothetical protein